MIKRDALEILLEMAKGYFVIVVTGPRQSGKTTLVKATFPQKPYVSLENPDEQVFAEEDPKHFLNRLENTNFRFFGVYSNQNFSYI